MPKINVYLPDELAEAVRESGLPVSAICQRALEQSVRRVTAIRETTLGDLDTDDPTAGLARFTERARAAIRLGIEQARAEEAAGVGTEHLLHGLLAEGTNLALHVLRAVEIDPGQVARDLAARGETRAEDKTTAARFTGPAANVLELTATEAIALGHNYVGCEHLLLGLIAEPDGTGGQVLRACGAELRLTRRTVVAALAGYVHLRAQGVASGDGSSLITAVREELRPLTERLERLERHVGIADQSTRE
jgi:ATP-dependent Clp protease ATP-binding subunit ClpA/post-segregation antitoxin (ccd killing protein)